VHENRDRESVKHTTPVEALYQCRRTRVRFPAPPPVVNRDQLPTVQRDRLPTVQRDRLPTVQRDRLPTVQRDRLPTVQRDRLPTVQRDRLRNSLSNARKLVITPSNPKIFPPTAISSVMRRIPTIRAGIPKVRIKIA
jgi:hypothetical protein